jgi:hypothetical protein
VAAFHSHADDAVCPCPCLCLSVSPSQLQLPWIGALGGKGTSIWAGRNERKGYDPTPTNAWLLGATGRCGEQLDPKNWLVMNTQKLIIEYLQRFAGTPGALAPINQQIFGSRMEMERGGEAGSSIITALFVNIPPMRPCLSPQVSCSKGSLDLRSRDRDRERYGVLRRDSGNGEDWGLELGLGLEAFERCSDFWPRYRPSSAPPLVYGLFHLASNGSRARYEGRYPRNSVPWHSSTSSPHGPN